MKTKVISWLNQRSELFSHLMGEQFTRRDIILSHIIAIGMMVGGFAVEHYPVVSVVATLVVGLSVKRLIRE